MMIEHYLYYEDIEQPDDADYFDETPDFFTNLLSDQDGKNASPFSYVLENTITKSIVSDLSYGWAKLNNEYLASIAFKKHGVKNTIFWPFSGYGSDQDSNYPFPSIVLRAINHSSNKKCIVWGSGYQMRDFIHIKDVIRGSLFISKKIKNGKAVNLSSGKLISFISLSKKILKILGKKGIKVMGNSSKPEGVFARGGSTSLQKKYGFVPNITIDQGIKWAIQYFYENK